MGQGRLSPTYANDRGLFYLGCHDAKDFACVKGLLDPRDTLLAIGFERFRDFLCCWVMGQCVDIVAQGDGIVHSVDRTSASCRVELLGYEA